MVILIFKNNSITFQKDWKELGNMGNMESIQKNRIIFDVFNKTLAFQNSIETMSFWK
jgi:hypothetical protein